MTDIQKFPNHFASDQFIKYIDKKEIASMTESLAHTISQKYAGKDLVVVGVLKGCLVFTSELLKRIKDVNIFLDFISIKSTGRSSESIGTISIDKDIATNINGKSVLIVQQIIDTGRALEFIKNRLELSKPESIEVLTLLDKPYKRVVQVKADYIGKQIEDQFVVGHGLDLDQFGRNLDDIYRLQYPN